jgi:hypothetical protein
MTWMHHWMPLAMGGGMGLMIPFMLHDGGADGLVFVLAHGAAAILIGSLAFFLPRVRQFARAHLSLGHVTKMGGGMVLGFGVICAYCLMIGGSHWI